MLELPKGFKLPYEVPPQQKPFSDYEWDPSYPGTFKPGTRGENYDFEEVEKMWEGRDNPAALQLPQDVPWQIPLAPPEDILSWLDRIGLLVKSEDIEEDPGTRGERDRVEEDFDLDDENQEEFDLEEEGGDDM